MQVIFNQFNQCRKSKMLVAQKKNIELPHKTLYLPSGQDEPLPDEEGSGGHVFYLFMLVNRSFHSHYLPKSLLSVQNVILSWGQ